MELKTGLSLLSLTVQRQYSALLLPVQCMALKQIEDGERKQTFTKQGRSSLDTEVDSQVLHCSASRILGVWLTDGSILPP